MQLYCEKCKIAVTFEDNGSGQLICPECGHEVDRASMPPGTVIQGFKIDYEIGRGTSGAVYKAKQLNLDRNIALKVLHHEVSTDDEFVERFFREARAAASLSSPYIVQAIDAGAADGGIYYFAMELIEGENLEEEIARSNGLAPERGLEVALIVARGMEYAWDRKELTHGDIKPENILVNRRGEAKLADLGLAKIGNDASEELMATPMYAPPEVISGEVEKVGMTSDIYSFGATAYHMFAGHPPFQEDDSEKVMDMHLYEHHDSLSDSGDFFSQELSDLIDQMLEKDCHNRPASWHDIVKSLENIYKKLDNSGISLKLNKPKPPPLPKTVAPSSEPDISLEPGSASNSKKNSLIALAAALVAGIVTVGVFMALNSNSNNDNDDSDNQPGVTAPVKPGNFNNSVEERWLALKKELDVLDDDKIIAVIKDFNKRYKPSGAVKKEINQTLVAAMERKEQKQKSLADAKLRQKQAREDYLESIKSLTMSMNEVQAGSSHEPFQLRDMKSLAAKLLKRNSSDKLVAGTMADKAKKALLAAVSRLDGRMKSAEARKRLINKKAVMLRGELARRAVLRRKLDAIGKTAGATAAYFETLNRISLGLKNGDDVIKLLIAGKKLKLSKVQRENLDVLNKMVADGGDIKKFFIGNEASFAGLTIPGLPGKESTYKISKFKKSYIVLLRPIGGAIVGYKKKWSAISNRSKVALVIKGIENSKVPFAKQDDSYLVFGWLLRDRLFGSMGNLLGKSKKLSKSNKATIVNVMSDVKRAVLERAAWTVLRKMLILEKQQNPEIMELISDMTVQYSDTDCYKKNRQVIVMLQQRYAGFGRDRDFARMFKHYIKVRKRNITLAVNLTATMSARFAMNKDHQKRVAKVKKSLLVNIGRSKTIEGALPFMGWNLEQPGAAVKYLAKESGRRGGMDQLRLSAEVDTGLWYDVRVTAGMKDSKLFNDVSVGRYSSESSFATLFGVGVIAYRLGKFEVADDILYKMVEIAGLTEALKVKDEPVAEAGKYKPAEAAKTAEKPAPGSDVPGEPAEPPAPVLPGLPGPPKNVPAPPLPSELFPDENLPPEAGQPVRGRHAAGDNSQIAVTDTVKMQRRMTLEYALLIKRYGIAEQLGAGHVVTADKISMVDVNIAMLHLLALIQNSKINPADAFAEQLDIYSKLFGDKFADDIAICDQVGEILKGKRLSAAVIKNLRLCRDIDTCSRMLSAAIACTVFYGNKPYPIGKFTALMKKNVSAAFGSGPLWRSLLLLNLADPENSLGAMTKTVELYKQDRRVVAVYGYPELMMIDAGVVILNGKLPLEMILERMRRSLKNSPVSGLRELFAMKAMKKFSMPQMEKYLRELKPGQHLDFSLLFLGVMRLVNEKPSDAVEFISRNRSLLFKFNLAWEEKLMIDNMMLWAAAWRQENVKP
ncbi:MAG: protein kinase [Victivallaceae bacterium]|nr:protein kinase [Victivallaceae bacterium]